MRKLVDKNAQKLLRRVHFETSALVSEGIAEAARTPRTEDTLHQ